MFDQRGHGDKRPAGVDGTDDRFVFQPGGTLFQEVIHDIRGVFRLTGAFIVINITEIHAICITIYVKVDIFITNFCNFLDFSIFYCCIFIEFCNFFSQYSTIGLASSSKNFVFIQTTRFPIFKFNFV
uniref:Uncharacterized protein n=1 Tax=Cacopsylla melanoneura TaxID=428564 RepID=A0A8D8WC59_9HEMI